MPRQISSGRVGVELSTDALSFFISSAVTLFLSPWLKDAVKPVDLAFLLHVGVYLGIAGTLIAVVTFLQWVRDRSIARQRKVPADQVSD